MPISRTPKRVLTALFFSVLNVFGAQASPPSPDDLMRDAFCRAWADRAITQMWQEAGRGWSNHHQALWRAAMHLDSFAETHLDPWVDPDALDLLAGSFDASNPSQITNTCLKRFRGTPLFSLLMRQTSVRSETHP